MKLGEFMHLRRRSDRLPDFERDQTANHSRTEDHREDEGKQPGARRAKGDVLKQIQKRKCMCPVLLTGESLRFECLIPKVVNCREH